MKILMVCLGNICRSPLAEGILREKLKQKGIDAQVDSAGTASYHEGEKPDRRSQAIAKKHGIDISLQSARQFTNEDFEHFDKIFVMDKHNYNDLVGLAAKPEYKEKVEMILNVLNPGNNNGVPDPYYGGHDGFQKVYDMLDKACSMIAENIETTGKS